MSTRRAFILAAAAWPAVACASAAFAQSKPPVLIGWLSLGSQKTSSNLVRLKEGLAALGWKEGSNYVLEERWADGRQERLLSLAQELAARKPAVIVASTMLATISAAKVAGQIPIVMFVGTDPVAAGVVKSLARPGGMVTGVTSLAIDVTEKYVELLLAAAPRLRRIGFLSYSHNPNKTQLLDAARRSVAQHQVEARFAEAGQADEIEPALARLAKEGVQGLVVLTGGLLSTERHRIVKLALAERWPVIGGGGMATGGGLLSYSADMTANQRRAAYYVDRILKGAKPGDLPIEQPTKFELVINLKTARLLKFEIPRELAVRADRVIE